MRQRRTYIVDKLFWASLILYLDTGGFLNYHFRGAIIPGVLAFDDFFAFVMLGLFLYLPKKMTYKTYNNTIVSTVPRFRNLLIFFFLYLAYFIVIFGLYIPLSSTSQFIRFLQQSRFVTFNILLLYPVFFFTLRSLPIFVEYLLKSSILVLTLFVVSILSGIDFVPFFTGERLFSTSNGTRYFLYSYGLMSLLPNLAMVVLLFKSRTSYRRLILIAGGLMSVVWLLSITRRHILGMIIVFFIYGFFRNYLLRLPMFRLGQSLKPIVYICLFTAVLFVVSPSLVTSTAGAVENTYRTFVLGEKTVYGKEDTRLRFEHHFFSSLIAESPFFGTGYSVNWYSGEGNSEGGNYEAADYPLLASLAAFGAVGFVVYSYYYIWLLGFLRKGIVFFRRHYNEFRMHSIDNVVFVSFLGAIIYLLLNYQNLFGGMGLRNQSLGFLTFVIAYGAFVRFKNNVNNEL